MKIGYSRVSTMEQHEEAQMQKLKEAGCEKIFLDKDSGLNPNREQFTIMKQTLREGDTLIILELSRLGRDLLFVLQFVEYLKKNNINFVSLRESIDISSPAGNLILSIFAAVASFEIQRTKERQKLGIEYSKSHGVKFGRPKTDEKKIKQIIALHNSGLPIKEIEDIAGVSKSTIYRTIANNKSD